MERLQNGAAVLGLGNDPHFRRVYHSHSFWTASVCAIIHYLTVISVTILQSIGIFTNQAHQIRRIIPQNSNKFMTVLPRTRRGHRRWVVRVPRTIGCNRNTNLPLAHSTQTLFGYYSNTNRRTAAMVRSALDIDRFYSENGY